MPPDARSVLVHYMRSLALPEPVCQTPTVQTATVDPQRVTCPRCLKKLPLSMQPEKWLLAQVRQLAHLYGWLCYHTRDSRKSEPGFPDCCLVKPPRLILAELKRDGAQPTIAQQAWLDACGAVPAVESYCWRPADLDVIVEVLSS